MNPFSTECNFWFYNYQGTPKNTYVHRHIRRDAYLHQFHLNTVVSDKPAHARIIIEADRYIIEPISWAVFSSDFSRSYLNPLYTGDPLMSSSANSEDPDKIPNNAAFHQILHCLIDDDKNDQLRKKYNLF